MKSNRIISTLSVFVVIAAMITSCKKEEEPVLAKPTISGLEVGHENNLIGHPGQDLHVEAQIVAPAKIREVKLEIHAEAGQTWSFNQIYTSGFAGAKNADFHEHLDIPATAELGEYHLHLIVIDEAGNSTTAESELELQAISTDITAENFSVSYVSAEDELHVEADITAPLQIASLAVEIHGPHEDEFDVTGTANGQTTYSLHEHIGMSAFPSGHYDVHLVVEDMNGNVVEFDEHFDK